MRRAADLERAQAPGVPLDGRAREAGNLFVGETDAALQLVGEGPESAAEDERDARLLRGARAHRPRGVGGALVKRFS